MAKRKSESKKRASTAPKPKHVSIVTGQRYHIHVMKDGKQVSEYIGGANEDGVIRMEVAPEAPAPVMTPSPISGT
jgi:hypothetical protein